MNCPHPTAAEGTSLGTLSPPTSLGGTFAEGRQQQMDNLLETPDSPQLLSVQLFRLCRLLFPFQRRAPQRSNSSLFQMGSIALPARARRRGGLQHQGSS